MESEHHTPTYDDSFCLPTDTYYELLHIRDQLAMYAQLIAPITLQEDDAHLDLTRNMLADCFAQLAKRLTGAMESADTEPDG
jgi:hypothetical protein